MSDLSKDPDLFSESHQESITTLLSHGKPMAVHAHSKYVVHASTIPLSTTVDLEYMLCPYKGIDTTNRSLFHGYYEGEADYVHCSRRSCMFMTREGRRCREWIADNCPCLEIMAERDLKPMCFMMYIKSLNRNLVPMNMEEYNPIFRNEIEPNEIMFCQNSTGVFDNSYPGKLRDKTGVTGWSHVRKPQIDKIMRHLWWYREHAQKLDLSNKTIDLFESLGDQKARHIVMQILHTINAMILKKLMALGPEICTYREIAYQTAISYVELLKDYTMPLHVNHATGQLIEPHGFYQELKKFGNFVKETFHHRDREKRLEWLKFKTTSTAFKKLFGTELRRLLNLVELEYVNCNNDYTLSPAFMFRAITMTQNRGMGYLPEALAECKRAQFRDRVNREVEKLPDSRVQILYHAMQRHLHRGGIRPNVLNKQHDEIAVAQANDIKSSVEVPLKGTASVDTYVKDGGKLEDARRLIERARLGSWKIPIRDLEDNRIIRYFTVEDSLDDLEDPERILFWISYQLFLNHWAKEPGGTDEWYIPWSTLEGLYSPAVMDASILHISEPSKERNLTKSHATLAWFLTPAAKMLQATLAMLPEHTAGLLESGHDWRHLKRISSESDESWFLHDYKTGKPVPGYCHIFKDWTESTDFIGKHVGYVHCKAVMDFIGFPRAYQQLVLKTIVSPQPVTEVVHLRCIDGEVSEPVKWTGAIREGYMMGNPITKPILHSVHCTELEITTLFLEKRGITLSRPHKMRPRAEAVHLDRKMCSKNTFSANLNPGWRRGES